MMRVFQIGFLFILVLLVSFLPILVDEAEAYIDPGTGSQILQIMIAAVLGGAFAIKTWWYNIVGFFRGKRGKKDDAGKDGDSGPAQ